MPQLPRSVKWRRKSLPLLGLEPFAKEPVHDLGIGLALGAAHDLPDEETQETGLPAAVGGDLVGMVGDHAVDVGRAWVLKEAILKLWEYTSPAWSAKYFQKWYFWATHSRLPAIIKVARMMKRHLTGILAFLQYRVTNALTESLNAKIQEIKYRARGYRNRENFRLAILFHCGKLDMNPL